MMKNIRKNVGGYIRLTYLRLSECLVGSGLIFGAWHFSFMALLWGLWILSPWGGTGGTAGYSPMNELASEFAWGSIAMILGACNMHFVIAKRRISLAIFSMLLGYFWSLVGISYLVGNISSAGGMVYLMIALFNFWVYKRLHG